MDYDSTDYNFLKQYGIKTFGRLFNNNQVNSSTGQVASQNLKLISDELFGVEEDP